MDQRQWQDRLLAYMSKNGLRLTKQRRIIAETFFESEGHPNIDELYAHVRSEHPEIGQATVYRTLKLLVDSGLATATRLGGPTTRYEPTVETEHHDHLICTRCGRVVEFHDEALEERQEEIAARHGFKLTAHDMELYGIPFACEGGECAYR